MKTPGTDLIIRLLTLGVILIVYGLTMGTSIGPIDSGELATAAWTWGVAHPTGYPLYTSLGFLWSHLPLGMRVIMQLNLFSLLCTAASAWLLERSARRLLPANIPDLTATFAVTGAMLMYAFQRTIWSQSTVVEVYSLHLLCISAFTWRFLLALETGKKADLLIAGICLGLAFSNHMTTILLIPGILILYFWKKGINKAAIQQGLLFLPGVIGIPILMYGLLMMRAGQEPLLNWGAPSSLTSLFRHVSGAQFQIWFKFGDEAKGTLARNFGVFMDGLLKGTGYLALIPAIAGIFALSMVSRPLLVFVLVNIGWTVWYAAHYDIHDIESYFSWAYFNVALLAAAGGVMLVSRLPRIAGAALLLPGLMACVLNFPDTTMRGNDFYEQYTRNVLENAPKDAIILTYEWDFFISPAYYLQQVEGIRPDVRIVDKELLRRSWYYPQLEGMYPGILAPVNKLVTQFQAAIIPFEEGEKFDPNRLEALFRGIQNGLIAGNLGKYPVLIMPEMVEKELRAGEWAVPAGSVLVPCPYYLEIVPDTIYRPMNWTQEIPSSPMRNYYEKYPVQLLRNLNLYRLQYETHTGHPDAAAKIHHHMETAFKGMKLNERQ